MTFKPEARGKTFNIQIQLSDDNGYMQGFDPIGSLTVAAGPSQGGP